MTTIAEKIISDLKIGILPTLQSAKLLCTKAKDYLIEDPNVIILEPPMTIVGDIHGQFYDLLNLFEISGECPDVNFCFLGDYVDRGYHGVETFMMLLALKVRYPTKVTLLRGNHETRSITQVYGFYDECMQKYGNNVIYRFCTDIFDLLPLAAVVGEKLFLVHGGLSPEVDKISDINKITRIKELTESSIMTDLCWSDPDDTITEEWGVSVRGSGFTFSGKVAKKFNHSNDIDCIVRAHQLVEGGYSYMFEKSVLTIFSAPNYCYRCGNTAAFLEVNEVCSTPFAHNSRMVTRSRSKNKTEINAMSREFRQFEAVEDQVRDNIDKNKLPSYFL